MRLAMNSGEDLHKKIADWWRNAAGNFELAEFEEMNMGLAMRLLGLMKLVELAVYKVMGLVLKNSVVV